MTTLQIPVFLQRTPAHAQAMQAVLFGDAGQAAASESPSSEKRSPRVFTVGSRTAVSARHGAHAHSTAAAESDTTRSASAEVSVTAVAVNANANISVSNDGVTLTVDHVGGAGGDELDDEDVAPKAAKGRKGAKQARISMEGLDFIVRNPSFDVPVAAFMGTSDAIAYIRDRHDTNIALRRPTVRLELVYVDPKLAYKDEDLAQELIDANREIARIYARS